MKKLILLIIAMFLIILAFISIPRIITPNEIIVGYGENWQDEYQAKSIWHNYTDEVKVENNVDLNKIGDYNIIYSLKFGPFTITKEKRVKVTDLEKPIIELTGGDEVNVCPNKSYLELGYKATDEIDGDLTDKVEIELHEDYVLYKVKDSALNLTTKKRKINYKDLEKPTITLKGNDTMTIFVGSTYNEPGYTVSDNCDESISSKVEITNNINTNKVGTYKIVYTVVDASGNIGTTERTVNVIKRPVGKNGTIYLTFDDGPSNLTVEILDILKEEGVKATFFVTSNASALPSVVKRAYNEGHTIALHTYSHNYSYVYSSSTNYFLDLDKISDIVYNIIGVRSKYIRFPGGSSNTVSRNYAIGIMSYLTEEVKNRGYRYFDWNVDSNDAGSSYHNASEIYNNVVNNLSPNRVNMVLMHDSYGHTATVEALRGIIEFAKSYGYTFKAIDDNTPMITHGVNN